MLKEEFITKSPVRILEKSIEGGLQPGNIGVVASRKGIGKTSVLVQMALDKLIQGEKVIHISFNAHTSYIISWYENIFNEIAHRKNLENIDDLKEQLVRNRVIMNFTQEGVTIDQITRSISAMIVDGGFDAKTIIVDGFDFSKSSVERFEKVKIFAAEMGLEIWYSCTTSGEEPLFDKHNVPICLRDYLPLISVLIVLEPMNDYIHFRVVKDHERLNPRDLSLKLDTKSLLIA
ncbi:MAG: hypothetical protein LLF89_01950, partial [Spirochaetaceae bacterium]|nr:hypothetical protein [Spirochaetaceae bacterium]